MSATRVLAVDIGAGHVACGVFIRGATGRLVLQQFALEPHRADSDHEGRWTNDVAQSLGAVAARTRLRGESTLAIPGHLALTKFLKAPSVAKEKRAKILAFEAAENIPYPLEEVVWDYLVIADDGVDLDVMVTAVKADAIEAVCAAASTAGFEAGRAIPAGLALRNGFRYNYPDVLGDVLVVNVGARSTQVLFLAGERFSLRTLSLAGNSMTEAIAEELRIDFAAAESLKLQVLAGRSELPANSPARAALQHAAAAFAHKLQVEITRSTVNHRRQTGAGAPAAIYLSGGGSLLPELATGLAEKLRLPVERYEPLRHVDMSADARAAGADTQAAVLADLVGLATRLIDPAEPTVTLLPSTVMTEIAFRKREPWWLAAAALTVVALLPPIVYFHQLAGVRRAEIAAIDRHLAPIRALQRRNDENLRQIEAAQKQITALRGAYAVKGNWVNFFADLQAHLAAVENVWLDSVKVQRLAEPVADAVAPADPNAAPAAGAASHDGIVRLTLSGRLLDVDNPGSKVSPQSFDRVKQLLQTFRQSQFVSTVENEHFDNRRNGLLRFDFTLVMNPKKPL
jgi:type IV pilus assembly protein PilM